MTSDNKSHATCKHGTLCVSEIYTRHITMISHMTTHKPTLSLYEQTDNTWSYIFVHIGAQAGQNIRNIYHLTVRKWLLFHSMLCYLFCYIQKDSSIANNAKLEKHTNWGDSAQEAETDQPSQNKEELVPKRGATSVIWTSFTYFIYYI